MLWIARFLAFAGRRSQPASVSNTANAVSSSDLTTYTFAAQALGAADGTRQILVCVAGQRLSSPSAVSSVTVGGITATKLVEQTTGNANDHSCSIWIAPVPTGTTGDVVVTFNTGHLRCAVSVWRAVNSAATAAATASATNSSTAVSTTIDVPAGGFAVAVAFDNGNTTYTWSGLTEAYDATADGNAFSSAGDNFAAAQSGMTVTATQASNNAPQALCVASVAPG